MDEQVRLDVTELLAEEEEADRGERERERVDVAPIDLLGHHSAVGVLAGDAALCVQLEHPVVDALEEMPRPHARVEHLRVGAEVQRRDHVRDVAGGRIERAKLCLLRPPGGEEALVDVADVLVRQAPEALDREVVDQLGEDVLLWPEVVVGVFPKHEGERLSAQVESDLHELAPAVLLDHVLADVGRELLAESSIGILVFGIPRLCGVSDAAPQEPEEDCGSRRRRLASARWQELPHDPVEARQVAVLAEVEEEDLVEVVEGRLRHHLRGDLLGLGLAGLGDLALVQGAHLGSRLRAVNEPVPERAEEGGRGVGRHDLDRLVDLCPDAVFDAVEVVEEDLAQAVACDLFLRERAAQLERHDALPLPDLRAEVLVLDLAEEGPVSHGTESEEPGAVGLAAVEG